MRRLVGYNRRESVKAVLMGLDWLNVKDLIMLRKTKLYRHAIYFWHTIRYCVMCFLCFCCTTRIMILCWRLFLDYISCCWLYLDIVSKLCYFVVLFECLSVCLSVCCSAYGRNKRVHYNGLHVVINAAVVVFDPGITHCSQTCCHKTTLTCNRQEFIGVSSQWWEMWSLEYGLPFYGHYSGH